MDYSWLKKEPAPKMLVEAVKLLDIYETPGKASNKVIMGWAKELGLSKSYSDDAIPWCGLFMGICAFRAGKKLPPILLRALSWENFGIPVHKDDAMLGDVLVYKRTGGGHVNLYVGEDPRCYHGIGGNQGNKTGITRILTGRLHAVRRPEYKIGIPPNVRKIFLDANGIISNNEL